MVKISTCKLPEWINLRIECLRRKSSIRIWRNRPQYATIEFHIIWNYCRYFSKNSHIQSSITNHPSISCGKDKSFNFGNKQSIFCSNRRLKWKWWYSERHLVVWLGCQSVESNLTFEWAFNVDSQPYCCLV